MVLMTPWARHQSLGHKETRQSPNGVNIIVECDTCKLAWIMPRGDGLDDYPVTLYRYYPLKQGVPQ